MKPWLVWTVGVALLAAAWAVVQITPDDSIAEAPFAVEASVGREARGRSIAVTVTDVRLGDRAVAGGWQADGTWLVVDVEAAARATETGALLKGATLEIDGLTYRASERPNSLFGASLSVDIARAGSLAFELPDELAGKTGVLRLSQSEETRLDSLIELPIDLASIDRETEVELLPTEWATP
jgi:hypothetical protein